MRLLEKTSKELEIQEDENEIEEINHKIKNNDYNQLKEVHHDKMVLETRKIALQNKIQSIKFSKHVKIIENDLEELKHQNKTLRENNSVLIEIVKEICKDHKISPGLQEKIKTLQA
ncbi:hypothetical protein [Candidatus Nitrosarchaeum limnium]|uniref:Uncharacterized protein n=1 Tax=Candidatus Nitrosarchaeum limnium BG20 TaxID=859192 RepID=S2E4C2_9ARCH|nr:hypothetical protein BG20_I0598 [Candidatus Nitrosarchaeum limnium BG20]